MKLSHTPAWPNHSIIRRSFSFAILVVGFSIGVSLWAQESEQDPQTQEQATKAFQNFYEPLAERLLRDYCNVNFKVFAQQRRSQSANHLRLLQGTAYESGVVFDDYSIYSISPVQILKGEGTRFPEPDVKPNHSYGNFQDRQFRLQNGKIGNIFDLDNSWRESPNESEQAGIWMMSPYFCTTLFRSYASFWDDDSIQILSFSDDSIEQPDKEAKLLRFRLGENGQVHQAWFDTETGRCLQTITDDANQLTKVRLIYVESPAAKDRLPVLQYLKVYLSRDSWRNTKRDAEQTNWDMPLMIHVAEYHRDQIAKSSGECRNEFKNREWVFIDKKQDAEILNPLSVLGSVLLGVVTVTLMLAGFLRILSSGWLGI